MKVVKYLDDELDAESNSGITAAPRVVWRKYSSSLVIQCYARM